MTGTGRIDKRDALLAAAFDVFAREGYRRARVDVIAEQAGVAKATVYNHFGDKETLFRQTVDSLCEAALADNLATVALLADAGEDLAATLTEVGVRLLDCHCDPRSGALRRLLYSETSEFGDLARLVQDRVTIPATEALADRLARLALAGRLAAEDPLLLAEQFTALLIGPLESRSRYGTREVTPPQRATLARQAAGTFLRAFGTGSGHGVEARQSP